VHGYMKALDTDLRFIQLTAAAAATAAVEAAALRIASLCSDMC
jgi:hypothetical protein